MSRIITTETEMTDLALVCEALDLANVSYDVSGTTVYMRSGAYANARIDTLTGRISGDTDFRHTAARFGLLRQFYSEAAVRDRARKDGISIDSRQVQANGDIVLTWSRS